MLDLSENANGGRVIERSLTDMFLAREFNCIEANRSKDFDLDRIPSYDDFVGAIYFVLRPFRYDFSSLPSVDLECSLGNFFKSILIFFV